MVTKQPVAIPLPDVSRSSGGTVVGNTHLDTVELKHLGIRQIVILLCVSRHTGELVFVLIIRRLPSTCKGKSR